MNISFVFIKKNNKEAAYEHTEEYTECNNVKHKFVYFFFLFFLLNLKQSLMKINEKRGCYTDDVVQ